MLCETRALKQSHAVRTGLHKVLWAYSDSAWHIFLEYNFADFLDALLDTTGCISNSAVMQSDILSIKYHVKTLRLTEHWMKESEMNPFI